MSRSPVKPIPRNADILLERRFARMIAHYGSLEKARRYLRVPTSTLCRYRNGGRHPDFVNLWRLADAGVDLNWLITGTRVRGSRGLPFPSPSRRTAG